MEVDVWAFGEGYRVIFNALAALMGGSLFDSLLRIIALLGILSTTLAFLRGRDPMVFLHWLLSYAVGVWLLTIPKTSVAICEVATGKTLLVGGVPYAIALPVSLVTQVGLGVARAYEDVIHAPDEQRYSQTGMLFAANLLHAAQDFHIVDRALRQEVDGFIQHCVVGDMLINQKYSPDTLSNSSHLLSLISQHPSPVRLTTVQGQTMSCERAVNHPRLGLKARLYQEAKRLLPMVGRREALSSHGNTYSALLNTHLPNVAQYYQGLTDSAEQLVLQNMMIHAIDHGLREMSVAQDSVAALLNNQFAKAQTQQRVAWQLGLGKALWFLPLLHSVLLMLCLGCMPVVLLFALSPRGLRVLAGLLRFIFSLELWPVLFSLLNTIISTYGASRWHAIGVSTLANIDSLKQLHADLSGVAGFLMLSVPFLARGLTSELGEAFAGLATTMGNQLQGSANQVAGEVASASFALGNSQTNTLSHNTLSANKHDSNLTDFHGHKSRQLATGAVVTDTPSGETIVQTQGAISHSAIGVHGSETISQQLSHAQEDARSATAQHSQSFHQALQRASHQAQQFQTTHQHEVREGHGVSQSDSAQATAALSRVMGDAQELSERYGVSVNEATQWITREGLGISGGVDSSRGLGGRMIGALTGVHGALNAHADSSRQASHDQGKRHDKGQMATHRSAREYRQDLQTIMHFAAQHHQDEQLSHTDSALWQMGRELRHIKTSADDYQTSVQQQQRLSDAKHYVTSHSQAIAANFNQAAFDFGVKQVGRARMIALEANPGNPEMMAALAAIKADFVSAEVPRWADAYRASRQGETGRLIASQLLRQADSAGLP